MNAQPAAGAPRKGGTRGAHSGDPGIQLPQLPQFTNNHTDLVAGSEGTGTKVQWLGSRFPPTVAGYSNLGPNQ
jgi:hypothetical protein